MTVKYSWVSTLCKFAQKWSIARGCKARKSLIRQWAKDPNLNFQILSFPIVCEFTQGEVAALTANFNTTSLLDGGRQIGEGGFGTVFLGYFRDGTKCAVKRLFKVTSDGFFFLNALWVSTGVMELNRKKKCFFFSTNLWWISSCVFVSGGSSSRFQHRTTIKNWGSNFNEVRGSLILYHNFNCHPHL